MKKCLSVYICVVFFLILSGCQITKTPQEELVCIQIQDRNGLSETISEPERLSSFTNVDFSSPQPYQKVLRLYRKDRKNLSTITSYHSNGVLWQSLEAQEMRAYGSYKEWFSNGTQEIEATVIEGAADLSASAQASWVFDGICQVWDEEGQLIAAIQYDKGNLHGTSYHYYPSGQLKKKLSYSRDKLNGEITTFWENGELKEKTLYQEDQKEGLSLGFWEDGKLCWQEEFSHCALKKGLYWNAQANLVAQVADGVGFKAIFENQTLFALQEIAQGEPCGVVKVFTASGQLKTSYHVKNGKKQGEEIEYFIESPREAAPLPKLSLQWDQDTIHGMIKTWYSNGQLQSQQEICRNKRTGSSCGWYRNGTLMFLEEYENDLLIRGQYYKKGQREPVSTVLAGNGTAFLYDENGIFMRKVTYIRGKPVKPE